MGITELSQESQESQEKLDAIAIFMNDEIREAVHYDLAPCEPITFLEEYVKRDPAFTKVLDTEFGLKIL